MKTLALIVTICLALSVGGCVPKDEPPTPPTAPSPPVDTPAPPTAMPQPPATITVTSTPIGAVVAIDGRDCGQAPVSVVVQPGRHHVRVIMDGYATWETTVLTTSGEHRQVDADLQAMVAPGVRTLSVDSRPSGARIYVNGRFHGETPLDLDLDARSRVVAVTDDYLPRQVSFSETEDSVTVVMTAGHLPTPGDLAAALQIDPLIVTTQDYGMSIGPSDDPNLSYTVSPGGRYLVYDQPAWPSGVGETGACTLLCIDLETGESVSLAAYLHGQIRENSPNDFARGPRFLAWTSAVDLVVLAEAYRDDAGRPDDIGLAIDLICVTTGDVKRLAWLPIVTDGLTDGQIWTSRNGSIVHITLFEHTGSVVRVNLDTGRTDTMLTGVPLDGFGGIPIVPSPDGTRVLIGEPLSDIPYVVVDLLTGREYPVAPPGDVVGRAVWSPDGTRVAFPHSPPGEQHILPTEEIDLTLLSSVMIVSATGQTAERIELPDGFVHTLSWLADSRGLLIQAVADVPDDDACCGWRFESRGLFNYRAGHGLMPVDAEFPGIVVDIGAAGSAVVFTTWDDERTRWLVLDDGGLLSEVTGRPVVVGGRVYAVDPDGQLVFIGPDGPEVLVDLPSGAQSELCVWPGWLVATGQSESEETLDLWLYLVRME